jgi:predicted Rossmann fold nucleotide-binding protein DprA/Smf involved in DNA uptake
MIRQGAALVTCARDVFEELGQPCETLPLTAAVPVRNRAEAKPVKKQVGQNARPADAAALSDLAANILGLLATEALQFDEIRTMASASAQQVSQGLIELQLAGFVRQGPDGYIRVL